MSPVAIIPVGIALALLFVVLGRKKKPSRPKVPWIIGPIWNKQSLSENMPASPAMAGTGWSIDFPGMVGSVNAVQWVSGFPRVSIGQTITIRFKIEGAGEFKVSDTKASPIASLGIMLQHKDDDMTGRGEKVNYRWFSGAEFVLREGEHELSVAVSEATGGGVQGAMTQAALQEVLRNLGSIGICFGSGGGRAHGVSTTQPATFELKSITIV